MRTKVSRSGFTLIELSIVLVIIALVSAMGMTMGSSMLESARIVNTNKKLDAIEAALMAYRMGHNRIPCPTDATLTESSGNFGVEAATQGTCTGGAPAANFTATISTVANTVVAEGAVPVRTLNLPDEYQVDGWGRKFSYAVWTPLTAAGGFLIYGVTPSCGAITVNNASGAHRSQKAAYALVSFGPDGHGGFTKAGTRYNAGSTNADEQTNAHYSNLGADTGYAATYVEKEATLDPSDSLDIFGDVVRYKERWAMQNSYDGWNPTGSGCSSSPGFRVDGQEAQAWSGAAVAVADIYGDGYPSLIIGAYWDNNGYSPGEGTVYVIRGTKTGFPSPLPLNSLNGTNGFAITLASRFGSGIQCGQALATGDVNGSGYPSIVIGCPADNDYGGGVYVVFGQPPGHTWPAFVDLTVLDGSDGYGTTGTLLMHGDDGPNLTMGGVLAVADLNGDGIGDIIIGSPHWLGGGVRNGWIDVLFGHGGAWTTDTTESWSGLAARNIDPLMDGTHGFRITALNSKSITIDHTKVGGTDLANFPLLVTFSGDTDIGGQAMANGYDIRFIAADGTLLNYERQSFSVSGGAATGVFWVQVPTISHTADTTIYILYGVPSLADGSNPAATWDSNFKAVYHLERDPGGAPPPQVTDSTSNANNGTTVNGPTQAAGAIGNGLSFNGTNNYVDLGSGSGLKPALPITMSLWLKLDPGYVYGSGVFFTNDSLFAGGFNYTGVDIADQGNGSVEIDYGNGGAPGPASRNSKFGTTILQKGDWYYLTAVLRGQNDLSIYINGVDDGGSYNGSASSLTYGGHKATIGSTYTSYPTNGILDEVRISNAARSADWINFEYHNIFDAGNDLTFGSAVNNSIESTSFATGDINGDGHPDLLAGQQGVAYLIFGQPFSYTWPSSFDVSTLSGSGGAGPHGVTLTPGLAESSSGGTGFGDSVAIGDINGDGTKDIIIGDPYADYDANETSPNGYWSGAVFVLFGHGNPWPATLDASTVTGSGGGGPHGFRINGAGKWFQWFGMQVAAGDVNGDGVDDLVIGSADGAMAPYSYTCPGSYGWTTCGGSAYVLFGSTSAWPASTDSSTINGTTGTQLFGSLSNEQVAYSGLCVGDLNGDGVGDVIITGIMSPAGGLGAHQGSTFVYFGKKTGWTATYDLGGL